MNLAGDSPDERKNEIKNFFEVILNSAPPPIIDISLNDDVIIPASNEFNSNPITIDEIYQSARNGPGGKATGIDGVPIEVLRIPSVCEKMLTIMNKVLNGAEPPEEWLTSQIVAIPKKIGAIRKEDYRGVALMSCIAKLYNKVLLKRIQPILDKHLRPEQNGFRPHRGTTSQILALRRVIEEASVHQTDIVIIFVDFRKAFDSVNRECVQQVLKAYNVPEKLINGIMSLYSNTIATVITPDGLTDKFKTTSGVLQGDTLAPFLFVLLLDWVIRTAIPTNENGFMLCRRMSSRHPEKRLSILGYADDLGILSSTMQEGQLMFDNLVRVASQVGLQINVQKTEVFTIPLNKNIQIFITDKDDNRIALPRCNRFVYLGGLVPSSRDDFVKRKGLAWGAMNKMRPIFSSTILSDELRSRLFQAIIETVLLYNGDTWTLTSSLEKELDACHSHLLRAAFNIHWPARVTNVALYERAGFVPPSQLLCSRRLRLAGHLIRSEDYCPQPAQEVLTWRPTEPLRRGQGNKITYLDRLMKDAKVPDQRSAVRHIRQLAFNREI